MVILIFGIALVALIVFLVLRVKYPIEKDYLLDSHSFFTFMSWVSGIVVLGSFISFCSLSTTVSTENTIDEKIKMYQEENANIEKDIDKVVKEYLKHEHDTYADLKTEESSITLVTLFPDLKSDNLVQQQLNIYVRNNSTIKYLKEEKIDISKKKWILYFGM